MPAIRDKYFKAASGEYLKGPVFIPSTVYHEMDGNEQQAVYKCREEAKARNSGQGQNKRGIAEVSQTSQADEVKALKELVAQQNQTVTALLSEIRAIRVEEQEKRVKFSPDANAGIMVPRNQSTLARQGLSTDNT